MRLLMSVKRVPVARRDQFVRLALAIRVRRVCRIMLHALRSRLSQITHEYIFMRIGKCAVDGFASPPFAPFVIKKDADDDDATNSDQAGLELIH